ncbi:MAG: hypothetical protein QE278_06410 [Limnobacter sp.]|nr:hypothetical protein [Limnobacter sp.]
MKIKGVQHSENLTEEQTQYVASCLGLQLSKFHGVAELREAVADRVDRFVNRLNPEKPRERFFNQDLSMRRELMRKGLDRPGSLDFAMPSAKKDKVESKPDYFELQRQGELTRKLSHGNAASRAFVLGLFAGINQAKSDRVLDLMQSTHCHVYVDDYQAVPSKISILFGLSSNTSDAVQNVATFANRVGSKYAECRELADHFVDLVKDGRAQLEEVSGYSLGGGLAQGFLARVNVQIPLDPQPASILLDPQLLNNRQARFMTKGVTEGVTEATAHPYDWTQPRGLMVTLNYPPKPAPNLVHIMKGAAGYKYPGLAELQLVLKKDDGFERVVKPSRMDGLKSRLKGKLKGTHVVELKTREPLANSYGYHGDPQLFVSALYRFTGSEGFETKDWWQIHGDKA